jgi:hypothetical protein
MLDSLPSWLLCSVAFFRRYVTDSAIPSIEHPFSVQQQLTSWYNPHVLTPSCGCEIDLELSFNSVLSGSFTWTCVSLECDISSHYVQFLCVMQIDSLRLPSRFHVSPLTHIDTRPLQVHMNAVNNMGGSPRYYAMLEHGVKATLEVSARLQNFCHGIGSSTFTCIVTFSARSAWYWSPRMHWNFCMYKWFHLLHLIKHFICRQIPSLVPWQ